MPKNKKKMIAFIVLLILISIGGCKNVKENKKNETVSHIPNKFGATYMTMNNPYFAVLNDSIKEVVEANGDILITRDPSQDQKKQNQQIQEMIDEGVKAIFLNPVDWKEVKPALEKCKQAGVDIFNIDTNVFDEQYVVSSIVSDNYDAGVQCAQDMIKKKEHGNIIIINHANIISTNQRVKGFLDTIKGNKSFEVVAHKRTTAELEVAMEQMREILEEEISFDVVLGGNDPTALGALAAMQSSHMEEEILVYGIDGSPDGKAMIKVGYLEGSSAQSPMQIGRTAAVTAYRYLSGEKVRKKIIVPVTLITSENLSEYDIAGWQ